MIFVQHFIGRSRRDILARNEFGELQNFDLILIWGLGRWTFEVE